MARFAPFAVTGLATAIGIALVGGCATGSAGGGGGAAPECAFDAACDDGDECTQDVCADQQCVHLPIENCTPAAEGDTLGEGEQAPECASDAECNDGDACTADACLNDECVNLEIQGCTDSEGEMGGANAAAGQATFEANCQTCHGEPGVGGVIAQDLAGTSAADLAAGANAEDHLSIAGIAEDDYTDMAAFLATDDGAEDGDNDAANDNESDDAGGNDDGNGAEGESEDGDECSQDSDCDEGDLCTHDTCVDGDCIFTATECAEGTACDPETGSCEADGAGEEDDGQGDEMAGEALYDAACAACHGGAAPDLSGYSASQLEAAVNSEEHPGGLTGLSDQAAADLAAYLAQASGEGEGEGEDEGEAEDELEGLVDANPDVDFDHLTVGDSTTLAAPSPQPGAACTCSWVVEPSSAGTLTVPTWCETGFTASQAGDLTVTVEVTCEGTRYLYAQEATAIVPGSPACTVDADCDDGLFCTGVETCDVGTDGLGSCIDGTNPCAEGEACDEDLDVCE